MRVDRADAVDLVGDDRDPDAGAADDHRPIGRALADHPRRRGRRLRVVDRLLGVRSDVDELVPGGPQRRSQSLLQLVAGMVGSDGDAHQREATNERLDNSEQMLRFAVRSARAAPVLAARQGRLR